MNHQVINMDCVEYLSNKMLCPQLFDLIIADPPFNIGHGYNGFEDRMSADRYFNFTSYWVLSCWDKLKDGGALVLHGSPKVCREFIKVLDLSDLEQHIEQEIVWAYNFGQCNFNKFIETHCRAIVVRKPGGTRKWNVESVMTPSKRLLMGDKRVETSKHKGMIPFGTVWGVKSEDVVPLEHLEAEPNWGRVQGNNKERRKGHPNQLPEKYVERMILAYSGEGDTVFDPFGGSGTTITVAKKLGRNGVTTDISEWNCESIKQRLKEVE